METEVQASRLMSVNSMYSRMLHNRALAPRKMAGIEYLLSFRKVRSVSKVAPHSAR